MEFQNYGKVQEIMKEIEALNNRLNDIKSASHVALLSNGVDYFMTEIFAECGSNLVELLAQKYRNDLVDYYEQQIQMAKVKLLAL